jgi:uracil-DNA glycosylase family 4
VLLTKEEELQKVYQAYAVDPVFNSLKEGVNFVPGYGPLNAKVMLVGFSPGKYENEKRRPFSGRNGKNLASLFEDTGYHVEQTFRTELVKYWPKSEGLKKREVTRSELMASLIYLKKEIEVINPTFVAMLGRNVLNAFYPEIDQIYPVYGGVLDEKYIPMYDPSLVMHRANKWPLVRSGFEKLASLANNA